MAKKKVREKAEGVCVECMFFNLLEDKKLLSFVVVDDDDEFDPTNVIIIRFQLLISHD